MGAYSIQFGLEKCEEVVPSVGVASWRSPSLFAVCFARSKMCEYMQEDLSLLTQAFSAAKHSTVISTNFEISNAHLFNQSLSYYS